MRQIFSNVNFIVKEPGGSVSDPDEERSRKQNNGNKMFKSYIMHLITLNWDERHIMQKEFLDTYSRPTVKEDLDFAQRIISRKERLV